MDLLSLGDQYLSDFRDDDIKPPKYPLNLVFCPVCYLVQLRETTPSSEMYTPRYGFKSGVNNTIKADLKSIVDQCLEYKPSARSWLDIASNDGTLLSFVPKNIRREGIDPIEKLCAEAKGHADRIVCDFFNAGYFKDIKFDVVTSISMFYDIDDPNKFVSEVKSVMAETGIWSIQQNYLLTTLELNAVDNICHEHLEYYSLIALDNLLARHGLEVFDIDTSMVNGGVIRTLVARIGQMPVKPIVKAQRARERLFGLATIAPYEAFKIRVVDNMAKLKQLVTEITNDGKKVYIYGASTRGGTIWQLAGLDVKLLPKAVERNPGKVGKKIASIGVPIISEEEARADKPDYMLVSPWFFRDEFIEREKEYLNSGGRFIFPLPELEIV